MIKSRYKIAILGSSGVKNTAILQRLVNGTFTAVSRQHLVAIGLRSRDMKTNRTTQVYENVARNIRDRKVIAPYLARAPRETILVREAAA
jgi:hypothetical protein